MPWTNYGKEQALKVLHTGGTLPEKFYMALCNDGTAPSAASTTLSTVGEVPGNHGYTSGGEEVTGVAPTTESNNTTLTFANVVWTADGGDLPDNEQARWAVLVDDQPTAADRKIWYWWDLVSNRQVSDGQSLTLVDAAIRLLHES